MPMTEISHPVDEKGGKGKMTKNKWAKEILNGESGGGLLVVLL